MKKKSKPAQPCRAYSRATLKQIWAVAMKITGATSVSHIYPRAYCVAKPAPLCAVFVTPWMDSEPQSRNYIYSASWTISGDSGIGGVTVGDWCSLAYITTPGCGSMRVIENLSQP